MNSVGMSAKRTINDILTDSPRNGYKRSSSLVKKEASLNERGKDMKMKIEEGGNHY